jgi:heterodisulfide reductase subunit C
MMMTYKIKTMDFFSDVDLGIKMFVKGKLHLLPKRTKDRTRLNRVFARTANKQK